MFKQRKLLVALEKYRDAKEAIVITGFRRVGKTALLRHIYEQIPSDNKIFLDLESPVNQRVFEQDNYEHVQAALSRLGIDFSRFSYIFLDEIQYVKNLPSVVKYLYDLYEIKFYLTGSSSFYLKNLFSESLSGRKFVFELYPLDFEEFLWFKDVKTDTHAGYDQLSGLYEEYLLFGGFPSVTLKDAREEKQLALDDVLGSYFQLDVEYLAHFRDNQNLKRLLFLLSSRVGSKPEIGKLADTLGVSRQTVYQYLDFFKETYLIHLLSPLSGSRDVQIRVQPKVYFIDTGILNRVGHVSRGQLFENKVFNQLIVRLIYERQHTPLKEAIFYYQLKTGSEIDFVVEGKTAYEVKTQGSRFDVKKMNKNAMKIGISHGEVVTLEKVKEGEPGIIYPYAL